MLMNINKVLLLLILVIVLLILLNYGSCKKINVKEGDTVSVDQELITFAWCQNMPLDDFFIISSNSFMV